MGAPDRTPPANPPAELPEATTAVRPLRPHETGSNNLAASLVPVVDGIRQLYTDMGIRPYRVFLVHVQWAGGERGLGEPQELSRREILPTPRVRDMSATSEVLRATGLTEEGGISIDQISAKYSEDDLMGITPDLKNLADPRTSRKQVQFYWEVVENRSIEPTGRRRRYRPISAPTISKDGFQWIVSLTRQDAERSRSGGSGRVPGDL